MMNNTISTQSILGFDPKSSKYEAHVMRINRDIATYILNYHNFDNRNITRPQVIKLRKNICDHGWLRDGDPIRFNLQGNLTEGQHRLTVISEWDNDVDEFEVVFVTGVTLDCFTKTAANKPRTYKCEIQRKDKTATPVEIATLNDLCQRQGKVKLNTNNAVKLWKNWKSDVKEGISISNEFIEDTSVFGFAKKAVRSWASLCVRNGYNDEAEVVLELLRNDIIGDKNTLASEALDVFYGKESSSMSNEGRIWLVFCILCALTDIVLKNDNAVYGKCQFGYNISSLDKNTMKKRGVYNKFVK